MTIPPDEMRKIIGEAIGQTSMCWKPYPTGVFDSTKASKIVNDTIGLLDPAPIAHGDVAKAVKILNDAFDFEEPLWICDNPNLGTPEQMAIVTLIRAATEQRPEVVPEVDRMRALEWLNGLEDRTVNILAYKTIYACLGFPLPDAEEK